VITDKIRRVGDKPAYNLVPPGIANFPGGNQLDFRNLPYKARLAQAQQLMRQAGFGPDRRAKTSYMIRSTTAGTYRAAAAAIQEMLALIFIDAPIIANDFAVFNHAIQAHDFDISEPGWSADFNDAQTFLQLFRTGDGNNWGQYSNAKFDTLMTASEQQTDLTARGRILAEAEAVLLEDQAVVPLFFWIDPEIAWPYVKGWVPNPIAYHRSRWIVIDEKARAAQFAT
jgi:oligopeptide transport system substrate-binding protein